MTVKRRNQTATLLIKYIVGSNYTLLRENGKELHLKILTVAITAIVVSLDSFMAGFSLSLNKRASSLLPSAVSLITLLLCAATSFIGEILSLYAQQAINYLGAALLFLLAVSALLHKEEQQCNLSAVTMSESLAIGVAVGMDAAIANFSFAGDGLAWITPIVFALTHYLAVACGQVLARKVVLRQTNVFSALILAVLGVSKLL